MTAYLLQTLPCARLLAATLVLAASGLHFGGILPPRWLATAMLLALPVVLACGALAFKAGSGFLWAVRAPAALLIVGPLLLWQVHDALERRLPARLEGRDLQVTGMVDAMPQRFDFGDRVRFTLDSCRVLDVAGEGHDDPAPGVPGDCGLLERLQLDWGAPRAKDRVERAAQMPGNSADQAGRNPDQAGSSPDEAGSSQDETGSSPDEAESEAGKDAADEPEDGVAEPARRVAIATGRAARNGAGGARPAERREEIWPEPGQFWRLTVRLKRPVATANPGGFDLELRYLQQGVGAIGRVYARQRLDSPSPDVAWRPGSAVLVAFESLRTRLRDRLEAVYARRVDPPGSQAGSRWPLLGVVAGLALGDQGAIGAGLWALFSRTGVSHLMAISGMHVTMLALIAAWVAARLLKVLAVRRVPLVSRLLGGRPRQVLVLFVAVTAAFGYALLSGWGIPSQRTCWMLTAAAAMSLSGRGRGSLDVTMLAAAIVALADPWAPSTAGFWLSFGAVAAILWCAHGQDSGPVLRMPVVGAGGVRVPTAVRDAVTAQWAATVGLAPLVMALFSMLSLIGPLANAFAIPWVSFVVTPLAVAAVLLGPVAEPIAAMLVLLDLWMIEHLMTMLRFLDGLPAASLAVPAPTGWTLAAALVGAAALIAPPGIPLRRAGFLCLLPMLFAPRQVAPKDELWITVLDIGQGSSILVETAGDRLLFDTGSGSGPERSAASRHLVPYLRARGIETIDTLVVSHLDVEHAGGTSAVLQALHPARLVTGFDPRLLQAEPALLEGPRHLGCIAGQRFGLGAATVEVLHPAAVAASRTAARENSASCVLRVASPAGSVLLPGDLPASAEAALVSATRARATGQAPGETALRADVLVVPQQGARQAAAAPLLVAVRPSFAVLQVGYRNRHRHPHPSVLERLGAVGAVVLRTDLDGAVQIRLRTGQAPRVYRTRRDAPPYWRIELAAAAPSSATAPSATTAQSAIAAQSAAQPAATAPSSLRRSPRQRRAPGPRRVSTGTRPARRSART